MNKMQGSSKKEEKKPEPQKVKHHSSTYGGDMTREVNAGRNLLRHCKKNFDVMACHVGARRFPALAAQFKAVAERGYKHLKVPHGTARAMNVGERIEKREALKKQAQAQNAA